MDSDVIIIPETVPETIIISSDDENCQGNERNRHISLLKATKRQKELEETVDLRRVKTEKHVTEATTSKNESSYFNSELHHKLRRVEKSNQSTSARYSEKIKSLFDSSPKRRHRSDSSSRESVSHKDSRSLIHSETSKRHSSYYKRGSPSKYDKRGTSYKDQVYKRDASTDRRTSPKDDKKKRKYPTGDQSSNSRETRRENYKKKFEAAVLNNNIIESEINETIANDWSSILKNGLPDTVKEALLKNQTIPANCPLLKAPTLNIEILNHVTKRHHKKEMDDARTDKQNQLGLGITAVGKGLSLLAVDHPNGDTVIKACHFIQQGCKILTDLHYSETKSRKEALKLKPPITALLSCERDDTLLNQRVSNYLTSTKFLKGSQQTNNAPE